MSQQTENIMKKIRLNKVILNIGTGKSGQPIETAKAALLQIINGKPNQRAAKKTQRDWGVRKGEPIGVAITVRGDNAIQLLKKLLEAKSNQIKAKSFDDEGNFSFGILEHIDIPGIKYDHKIGRGSRWCKRCGDYTAVIQKYKLFLCRRCFREVANSLGFNKTK